MQIGKLTEAFKRSTLIENKTVQESHGSYLGDRGHLSILHLHLHPLILPEDPPRHEGPRHQERDGLLEELHHLEPRQAQHQPSRCFLLYRVHLQRLVHHRDVRQVR